ncbi:MAG: beta-N-acetylglucosaminidase domain-containing protein [Limnochordia bacterium]
MFDTWLLARIAGGLKLTLQASVLIVMAMSGTVGLAEAQEHPVPNAGFEASDPAISTRLGGDWVPATHHVVGQATWVDDVVHSGNRAVKIEATAFTPGKEGVVRWSSPLFPAAPGGSHIEVSAWVKARDVVGSGGWYQLRYTLTEYDQNKRKIRHYDALSTEGSFDWMQVRRDIVLSQDTHYLAVALSLTECTGTAWMDDMAIRVVHPPRTTHSVLSAARAAEQPVIVPNPWQAKFPGGDVPFRKVAVVVPQEAHRVRTAVQAIMRGVQVEHAIVATSDPLPDTETLVILADGSDRAMLQRLHEAYPDVDLADLGAQGYFLSVQSGTTLHTVYVGANTEQGHFYGLQTLRQLIATRDERRTVPAMEVVDKPLLTQRGMAMGSQWFNKNQEAVQRMAELKLNYVYVTGTFLNGKFGKDAWREPFTLADILTMKAFLALTRSSFIDVTVSFSPRGRVATQYSDDSEINTLVDKMSRLYDAGYRDFAISFDDLQNIGQERLTHPEDQEAFGNDIGKAHLYFVSQIYQRLKARHADITMKVLPLWYSGPAQLSDSKEQYMVTLAQLPPEIGFVIVATDEADIDAVVRLTKRRPLVWDNFYTADFLDVEAAGLLPFTAPLTGAARNTNETRLAGYMILPATPSRQDASGASWLTSADYMWAPDRYDAQAAHLRAISTAVRDITNLDKLRALYGLLQELEQTPPPTDESERLSWAKAQLERLTLMRNDLPRYLPTALAQAAMSDTTTKYQALEKMASAISDHP